VSNHYGVGVLAILICSAHAYAQQPLRPAPPSFDQRLLDSHNVERARSHAQPLIWDEKLAQSARTWAEELARTNMFEHDHQNREGENLWMGTASAYQPEEMVGSWSEERAIFKSGRFPDVTLTKDWADVGHYTQMIWKTTTHVGCARAKGGEMDVLVCRYSPPGNWIGVEIRNDTRTAAR
jgi:Cysteine-rich secretory protein family